MKLVLLLVTTVTKTSHEISDGLTFGSRRLRPDQVVLWYAIGIWSLLLVLFQSAPLRGDSLSLIECLLLLSSPAMVSVDYCYLLLYWSTSLTNGLVDGIGDLRSEESRGIHLQAKNTKGHVLPKTIVRRYLSDNADIRPSTRVFFFCNDDVSKTMWNES